MNAVLGFLLAWSLRAAAVGVIGLAVVTCLRRRSGASRHFAWRVTLAVMLAVPVFLVAGPRLNANIESSPKLERTIRSAQVLPSALTTLRLVKIDSNLYQPSDSDPILDPSTLLFAAYLLGVAVMMRRWFGSLATIHSMAQSAEELPQADLAPINVKVATKPDLSVPITYGWLKPVILLPTEAREWPESRLNAALLHEQAHIARGDWLWISVAQWLLAIQWFNPAVWLCCEGLRASAEDAADDHVLATGITSLSYASELLSVAEASSGYTTPGLAMARQAGLKSRLSRIMAENRDGSNPTKRLVAGLAVSFGLFGFVLSASQIAIAASPYIPLRHVLSAVGGSQVTEPDIQKLASGTNVSVAFVTANEPNSKLWLKDGSAGGSADFKTFAAGHERDFWRMVNPQGERTVAVAVKLYGYQTKVPSVRFRFDGKDINFGFGISDAPSSHAASLSWFAFAVPQSLKVGTFEVGVGSEPYRVIGADRIGYGPLEAIATDRVASTSGDYDPVTKKPILVEHYDTGHTQATVKVHVPPGYSDKDLQLAAFDASGKELTSGNYMLGTTAVDGRDFAQADFQVNDPRKIMRVELRARDFEWVTFHNVQLYPDAKATDSASLEKK